jgi:S1-C subfamily serine protease
MAGQVIVELNGTATPTASDLTEVLANLSPGQKATVTVLQPDGSTTGVSVTLGTLPG